MLSHHIKQSVSLRKLLNEQTISGSVPCRVDCGNTLDVRPLALLLYSIHPVTVNIALDLRTRVKLYPFEDGYVKISSSGFPDYSFSLSSALLDSPIGLLAAILFHFNVHGVHMEIKSESPPRSGLGGSGALAICSIAIINEALTRLGHSSLNRIQQ